MYKNENIAEMILKFNKKLAEATFKLPDNFKIINPFNGNNQKQIKEITTAFYNKFYNDNNKRRVILGSSSARRGTAVTGVPFEDAQHLQNIDTTIRYCIGSGKNYTFLSQVNENNS